MLSSLPREDPFFASTQTACSLRAYAEEYWRKRSGMEFERMVYAFAEKYGISLQQAADHLARLIAVEQGTLARQQFEMETGIAIKGASE